MPAAFSYATQWLLEHGGPAVRYRTLRDILRRPSDDPELTQARRKLRHWGPALAVASRQCADGTWGGRLHTGDSRLGVTFTTEVQFTRLLEFGWEPGQPHVDRTVSLLLRLLEDESVSSSHRDLATYVRGPGTERYVLWFSRAIVAGLLARAGLHADKVVTGTARTLLDAAYRFVTGPVARKPVAGDPPVIRAEAYDSSLGYPAIPDLYLLQLFAYTPALQAEGSGPEKLQAVLDYVAGPDYGRLPSNLGLVRLGEGSPFVKGWKVTLPGPESLLADGRWAYGLAVLELFARLGAVDRYPVLSRWWEWLQESRRPGNPPLVDLPARAFSGARRFTECMRLEPDWRSPIRRLADLGFRVELIRTLRRCPSAI